MKLVYKILIEMAVLSIIVAFTFGAIRFKNLSSNLKRAFYVTAVALAAEGLAEILQLSRPDVNWIYYYSGPVEYSAIAWFFLHLINNQTLRKIILISIPLSIVLALVNGLVLQATNVNFTILKGILVAGCSFLYIQNLAKNRNQFTKLNYPEFVISMATMFYFTFSIIFWSIYRYLLINKDPYLPIFFKIFPVLAVANIIMYASYAVGFAMHKKPNVNGI